MEKRDLLGDAAMCLFKSVPTFSMKAVMKVVQRATNCQGLQNDSVESLKEA